MKSLREFAAAVQFMTRIPVPAFRFEPGMVLGGAKFFPLIGAVVARVASPSSEAALAVAGIAWLPWRSWRIWSPSPAAFTKMGSLIPPTLSAGDGPERACWRSCTTAASAASARWPSIVAAGALGAAFHAADGALPFLPADCSRSVPLDHVAPGRLHGLGAQRRPGRQLAHKIPRRRP